MFRSNAKRVSEFGYPSVRILNCMGGNAGHTVSSAAVAAENSPSPVIASNSGASRKLPGKLEAMEEDIEKVTIITWSKLRLVHDHSQRIMLTFCDLVYGFRRPFTDAGFWLFWEFLAL